jgi:phosphohistidine swiveling domain-containing protein
MATHFIRSLAELEPAEAPHSGAKAQSLSRLMRLNLSVPRGFVLLATAYDAFLDHHDLRDEYERLLALLRAESDDTTAVAAEFAARFDGLPLPTPLEDELLQVAEEFSSRFVAVRSSATVEDSDTAAWAGQLETSLNVPPAEIPLAVRKAWSSLFLPRAVAYAQHRGLSLENPRVAVILQETVDAAVSGVMLTADPVTQSYERLVLEAVFGLGESLVQGVVTPDSYWIDKKTGAVIDHRAVADQPERLTLDPSGGIEPEQLDRDSASDAKLTSEELEALVRMALIAEKEWGCPLDIEWCKDAAGRLSLLQARPITTLDRATAGPLPPASPPVLAKSIARGWSLLFCQIWHRCYTQAFYDQFAWRLGELLYASEHGVVTVYRAPAEFLTGMNEFITTNIDADPRWLHVQADILLNMVNSANAWLDSVSSTPLSEYSSKQLVSILDEFIERNVELGPRYVLMLWFPIQMQAHPRSQDYAAAIDRAVEGRVASHRIGGVADGFARRLAGEALRRHGAPEELGRAIPAEMVRGCLAGEALNIESVRAFSNLFLVTSSGVRHEDAATYCLRRGIPLAPPDDEVDDAGIARGVSAWPGKVRGPAQVVRGPDDFPSFTDGSVLVTSMTTPDFEVVMNRAAGIVTDEGGATSHAAILARELRKPTVIGTRVATRLCANGDLVEVNADDAFVQKLPVGKRVPVPADVPSPEEPGPYVLVVEDDVDLLGLLVSEFYRQAHDAPLRVSEEGSEKFALEGFRRLRKAGMPVSAVVVDLKLDGDPFGGTRLVEELNKEGYPGEQICVFSTMATAASMVDEATRDDVFARLEAVDVSPVQGNVFGKVHPGQEMARDLLDAQRGELATIEELVTAVLTRIGILQPAPGGSA